MQDLRRLFAFSGGDVERGEEADGLFAGGDDEEAGLDQPFGQSQGRRAFFTFERRQIFHFHAEEESGAAHFADVRKILHRSGQLGAAGARVGQQLFLFDGVEYGVRGGAGEGGSAVGRAVRAGSEEVGEFLAHPERAEGEAAADAFGPADRIRRGVHRAGGVPSAPPAGAAEPALHFVIKKQQIALVAQRAQGAEKFGRERTHAAFALDRLDHDGGGSFADGMEHAFEARGDVEEAIEGRTEAEFHFELSGRGDAAEGASVEGAIEGDDLVASRAVFAGQFEESFVGFGAAVAEKDFARVAYEGGEARGEFGLRAGEVEVGSVDEGGGLGGEGFLQRGVGVAEGVDRDAGGEVEVGAPVFVPHAGAFAADEREREARVGRDDIPLVEFGGGRGGRARGHGAGDGKERWRGGKRTAGRGA